MPHLAYINPNSIFYPMRLSSHRFSLSSTSRFRLKPSSLAFIPFSLPKVADRFVNVPNAYNAQRYSTSNSEHADSASPRTFWEGAVLVSSSSIRNPPVVQDLLKDPVNAAIWNPHTNQPLQVEDLLKTLVDSEYLEKAVLLFYRADSEFLIEMFPNDIPMVVVKNQPDSADEDLALYESGRANLRLEYIPGKSSMHVKSMLLYFSGFLRVVIGSGDLVESDWNQTPSIWYVQDFPAIYGKHVDNTRGMSFRAHLQDLLNKLRVRHNIPESLNNYNFNWARGTLVTSVPGLYMEESLRFYGHPALSKLVRQFMLVGSHGVRWSNYTLHYMCTALGKLTYPWVAEFRSSAFSFPPRVLPNFVNKLYNLRIYFPTASAVSRLNLSSPFRSFFNTSLLGFKSVLFQMPPTRLKILACLPNDPTFTHLGWVYCGSHNFSASAWGKLLAVDADGEVRPIIRSADGANRSDGSASSQSNPLVLKISNFELGVVFPSSEFNVDYLNKLFRSASQYARHDVPWSFKKPSEDYSKKHHSL